MVLGRGRLSFWDLLPDWAEPVRIWASQQLNDNKLTQLEILDQVNSQLRVLAMAEGITTDIPQASRSSLNRMAMRLATLGRRIRDGNALYAGMAAHLDHATVDENSIVLGEFLKTLILEINVDGGATTPKHAQELASAYKSAIQGQKVSADRRRKLQEEFDVKTAKVIDRVATEGGLSADTIAQLRREFLGVRPVARAEGHAA